MANKFLENVNSGDASLMVTQTGYTPYYRPDDTNLHDGSVRTNQGGLEYYDAKYNSWMPLPGMDVNITIGPHAQVVIDWAEAKMMEEMREKELLSKYPTLKQAKENYELIKAMVQNG